MVTNKEKIGAGIIGLVMLLAGFGGAQVLTDSEFNDAYYCSITNEVGVFHRLSASGKTGYYMQNESEESESCRSGRTYAVWKPLKQYAEEQGVSISEVLQDKIISRQDDTAILEKCNMNGCKKIK